jgi:hypothetical protein
VVIDAEKAFWVLGGGIGIVAIAAIDLLFSGHRKCFDMIFL